MTCILRNGADKMLTPEARRDPSSEVLLTTLKASLMYIGIDIDIHELYGLLRHAMDLIAIIP